jgi:hypothetical protein
MGILVLLGGFGQQKTNPIKANFKNPKMQPNAENLYKSDQITCLNRHPVLILSVPFDVAAYGICQRNGHGPAGQMLFERSFKVVDCYFALIAGIINAPAGVNEPEVFVEYVKVRRPQCTIRFGNRLRLVVKIEPGEFVLVHPCDHVLEIVFGVGVFTVGIDTDEFHALRGEFSHRSPGGLIGTDNIRAMVTGEKYYQYIGSVEIGQLICLAVCSGQFEIRRLCA